MDHTRIGLTYSMNKKKRWLLPDIIRQRILDSKPVSSTTGNEKENEKFDIDNNLRIEMIELENIWNQSTCLSYSNSKMVPKVIKNKKHRFNVNSLRSWISFNTRFTRRRRRQQSRKILEETQYGVQHRPGFFPSEVSYEFFYPRRARVPGNHKGGRSSLIYSKFDRRDYGFPYIQPNEGRKRRHALRLEYSKPSTFYDLYMELQHLVSAPSFDSSPIYQRNTGRI